jgi:hypothetical protein
MATLAPWEALVCEFTNDNTAFFKIHKETAQPVDENVAFHFDVTSEFGDDVPVWLTVVTGSSTTWSELTMIPTGLTEINEDLDNLSGIWVLNKISCSVWDVDPDTLGLSNEQALEPEDNNATLAPWQLLECTFTNEELKEGLTPGFWRNNADKKAASHWPQNPTNDFRTEFDWTLNLVDINLNPNFTEFDQGSPSDPTLYGGIAAEGGDQNALVRHCVAAKLNAEHPDIDYPLEKGEVLAVCGIALNSGNLTIIENLKDDLDEWNNFGASAINQNNGPFGPY